MGRKELREALQSTWHVYEPRKPRTPMTRKDIEDARERSEAPQVEPWQPTEAE